MSSSGWRISISSSTIYIVYLFNPLLANKWKLFLFCLFVPHAKQICQTVSKTLLMNCFFVFVFDLFKNLPIFGAFWLEVDSCRSFCGTSRRHCTNSVPCCPCATMGSKSRRNSHTRDPQWKNRHREMLYIWIDRYGGYRYRYRYRLVTDFKYIVSYVSGKFKFVVVVVVVGKEMCVDRVCVYIGVWQTFSNFDWFIYLSLSLVWFLLVLSLLLLL